MRRYIDTQLNKLSMYRLVTISLAALALITIALSFFTLVSPNPLEIIATAAVFVFAVGLSSWLVGYLFSVQAHGESSIITALILLFIFTPSLEPQVLAVYAFIGLIAGASKYLIVWKSRHIFNPAALAAVVIGLTTLAYASWWVATPSLFIPVLIATLLILYKTNRMLMGMVFIVTASILFVVTQLFYGEQLLSSILLIASWPILFFAGFMLTEPLTVPSKKRHAVIVAAVLGVLIAIPIKFGDFLIAPATALILANLYAAFVSRRATIGLTYEGFKQITPTSRELLFKTDKPAAFEPGQYLELTVPHKKSDGRGYRRMFSITSVPGDNKLSVAVKFYEPSSTYKRSILELKKGVRLSSTGVYGSFTLPRDTTKKVIMFAGGIGITPFISQLRTLAKSNEKRDITLVYAVNSLSEIAYKDELIDSGIKLYIVTEESAASTSSMAYVKSNRVELEQLEGAGLELADAVSYVSGPPPFVRSLKHQLKQRGGTHIKTDHFTGY